jgi:hypothetical protein
MAHKIRGELEIEVGLGLPRTTTTNRLAYTPPNAGYAVFDTDLGQIATWDGTVWLLSAIGDKINTTNGVAKETFSIQSASDQDIMKFTTGNGATQTFYASGTAVADITASASSFDLEYGTSALSITNTEITSNKPIYGVDDVDPSSLVTKNYVDINSAYSQSFGIADWVTVSGISTLTIPLATHGRPFVAGYSYAVLIQELIGGRYSDVLLSSYTNANGDVELETVGTTFDGRINISL